MLTPIDLETQIYGKHPSVQASLLAEKLNEVIKYLFDSQQAP